MAYERPVDLPSELKSGLTTDQQNIVVGLMNTLVYEQNMDMLQASQVATQVLQSSGMVYSGGWHQVGKTDETPIAAGVITKVDEDQRLVFGWASIIKDVEGKVLLDRQDDFIDDETELEKAAYHYVLNSRDGGEMHVRTGVSTMIESVVLSKEKQEALGIPEGTVPVGWWIGFRVNDENVWQEVKKGGYMGFSVHGTGQRNQTLLKDGEYTDIEKREFSTEQRRKMAEEGAALPDGSYPIANRQDLQNALQAIGRAKNRSQVLAHIRRRAKDLDMEDMLPDWAMSKDAGVTMSKADIAERTEVARAISKGDYLGHPFRGNQHTGASGGGRRGVSRAQRIAGGISQAPPHMMRASSRRTAAKPTPKKSRPAKAGEKVNPIRLRAGDVIRGSAGPEKVVDVRQSRVGMMHEIKTNKTGGKYKMIGSSEKIEVITPATS